MDPVSQFKFACPNCGQHLQARPGEAGRTIECPSCFKKLTVPQAPTQGGGKLIITAATADPNRTPTTPAPSSRRTRLPADRGPKTYVILGLAAVILVAAGFTILKHNGTVGSGDDGSLLWTDKFEELQLLDVPVSGRLNGWKFEANRAVWKGTQLTLIRVGEDPSDLSLEITFPLKGGELVGGKTFELHAAGPPFAVPIRIVWRDEQGHRQTRPCPSGYLLWVRFDQVTQNQVSGRLHLCMPDPTRSWVAGSFAAEVETVIR